MLKIKVKKITYVGKEPVYDMYVDEYHNFVSGDGVIFHNCDSLRYFAVSRASVPREIDQRTPEEIMIDRHKQAVFAKNRIPTHVRR